MLVSPNAKSFILDLLSTLRGRSMPVRALVAAGSVFGIGEDSIRVTLMRLQRRGVVQRNDRGQYRIAAASQPIQTHIASWTKVEDRVVAWSGGWIGVHTAGVARASRRNGRQCRRALGLIGFRELHVHLWIRPDNLRGGVAGTRDRLQALGLETAAPVFALSQLDSGDEARARGLWDVQALRDGYRRMRTELVRSARSLAALPPERAMVESFRLGGGVLRAIVTDPMLPEPLLPARERRALVEEMQRYDRLGRACWRTFMQRYGAPHLELPLDVGMNDNAMALAVASGSPT
jgi:phenylacetic acid degradation operon negative regulatory protein